MDKISIISCKGCVGKMARLQNPRILLRELAFRSKEVIAIDLDPQESRARKSPARILRFVERRSTTLCFLQTLCLLLACEGATWAQCNATQKAAHHHICDQGCREAFPNSNVKYQLCMRDCDSRCGLPDGGPTGPGSGPGVLPYDLVWKTEDLNGLPLNPHWWKQDQPTDAGLPSQQGSNGCNTPWDWNCTRDNPTIIPIAQGLPGIFNDVCQFSGPGNQLGPFSNPFSDANGHHVNWFTIAYTGLAQWDELAGNDDDVNVDVISPDQSAYTAQNPSFMHTEFSSDETIKNFTTKWWSNFNAAASQGTAASLINNREIIAIGALGLDCAHNCGSEIHPVYAMAVHVKDGDPSDDTWAIFARNWGDEGFCGQVDVPEYQLTRVYVRLDWRGGALPSSVPTVKKPETVWQKPYWADESVQVKTFPLFQGVRPTGFVVEFDLGYPNKGNFIAGELHLQWPVLASSGITPRPKTIVAADTRPFARVTSGRAEEGKRFEQFVSGLPADVRKQIADARAAKPSPVRMVACHAENLHQAPADFQSKSTGGSRRTGLPQSQTTKRYKGNYYQKLDQIFREHNIKVRAQP